MRHRILCLVALCAISLPLFAQQKVIVLGFDGANGTHLYLVRNPNYNAATDSKAARENNPDRFEFVVNANADDIFNRVQAGDLEDEVSSPSPKVLRQYVTNSSLKPSLHISSGDRT